MRPFWCDPQPCQPSSTWTSLVSSAVQSRCMSCTTRLREHKDRMCYFACACVCVCVASFCLCVCMPRLCAGGVKVTCFYCSQAGESERGECCCHGMTQVAVALGVSVRVPPAMYSCVPCVCLSRNVVRLLQGEAEQRVHAIEGRYYTWSSLAPDSVPVKTVSL